MCAGYVNVANRVALKGPGPIISCNRKRNPAKDYEFYAKEYFAGDEVLDRALRKTMGRSKVDWPLDLRRGPDHDLTQKWVYNREKQ